MNQFIDLHMHSYYSDDGEYTPRQLVEMAHQKGIKIMAIADHNYVKANQEALKVANKYDMSYIPAIEIDCTFKDINLHVLGYGVTSSQFNELGDAILNQELQASTKKIQLVEQLGFQVNQDKLSKLTDTGVYTGEMFGELLLNDERYHDHELLKPYRQGENRSDNPYVNFYWDFFSQGKPCYVPIVFPTLNKVIDLIHHHGGIAVLAHPGQNLKGKFEVFDEIIKLGIDGVEAFSSYHNQETNDYFYHKAVKNHLIYTCGSDFHGKTKPSIKLGQMGCFIDEHEIEEQLKKYHLI